MGIFCNAILFTEGLLGLIANDADTSGGTSKLSVNGRAVVFGRWLTTRTPTPPLFFLILLCTVKTNAFSIPSFKPASWSLKFACTPTGPRPANTTIDNPSSLPAFSEAKTGRPLLDLIAVYDCGDLYL